MMIEDQLEIFIFTYQRAQLLGRTLEQLAESPFQNCHITVMDNASTDTTRQICAELKQKLPNLKAEHRRKNVGCSANYLLCAEWAQKPYTWILCDDDEFDFSDCSDWIERLKNQDVDLISIGIEGHQMPSGVTESARKLALEVPDYFLCHCFVPSMIFRTELFSSQLITAGYHNAETDYPHFPFVAATAVQGWKMYVTQRKVINKGTNAGYAPARPLTGWLKSCAKIEDREIRSKAISEVCGGLRWIKNMLYVIAMEKRHDAPHFRRDWKALKESSWKLSIFLGLQSLALSPLAWGPKWTDRQLWKLYAWYRKKSGQPLPEYDGSR
jgi:glycosyltransferase involved in cell wall biosynthesis